MHTNATPARSSPPIASRDAAANGTARAPRPFLISNCTIMSVTAGSNGPLPETHSTGCDADHAAASSPFAGSIGSDSAGNGTPFASIVSTPAVTSARGFPDTGSVSSNTSSSPTSRSTADWMRASIAAPSTPRSASAAARRSPAIATSS